MRALLLISSIAAMLCGTAAAAPPGKQATYDAAQAAFDRHDWSTAIAGFEAVLPGDPMRPLGHSETEIAARLAYALEQAGRNAEARTWADRAIAGMSPANATLGDTLLVAGNVARATFDFRASITYFNRAEAIGRAAGDSTVAANAVIGAAIAGATVDPAATARALDAVLADGSAAFLKDARTRASVEDLRARAALNAGDLPGARRWSERAVNDSGGLTEHVDLVQLVARNDAGLAAALAHDEEGARRYLAYTGAGHMPDMNWIGRFEGELPICSTLGDGAGPNDSVIVHFAIGDDGRVQGVVPVYASRPGLAGEAFARAVSEWRWDPTLLKQVRPFWRASLILQLRCQQRPKPDGLDKEARAAVVAWLRSMGIDWDPEQRFAAAGAVRAHDDEFHAVADLLARRADLTGAERTHLAELLDRSHAPPAAFALLVGAEAAYAARDTSSHRAAARAAVARFAALVPSFRARFPDDPATAWLTLEWALALEDAGDFAGARPLLAAVLATSSAVLPSGAPVRRVALLQAGLVARRLGDAAAARASLADPGLTAQQCSLFDTHPVAASTRFSSDQFPAEAMRWGFEGYVREAFDIADDGRVANIRTVIAYPPFVFAPTSEKAIGQWRYVPPTLDGQSVGCTGQMQNILFRLPH